MNQQVRVLVTKTKDLSPWDSHARKIETTLTNCPLTYADMHIHTQHFKIITLKVVRQAGVGGTAF